MPYLPEPPPLEHRPDLNPLIEWLMREYLRIALVLNQSEAGFIEISYVAPGKPREGMIRFADGTSWNPGAGKGVYAYYSGAWNKLG